MFTRMQLIIHKFLGGACPHTPYIECEPPHKHSIVMPLYISFESYSVLRIGRGVARGGFRLPGNPPSRKKSGRCSYADLPTSKSFFAGENPTFCRTLLILAGHHHAELPTIVRYSYGTVLNGFLRNTGQRTHGCFMGWQPGFSIATAHTSPSVRSRLMPIIIFCSVYIYRRYLVCVCLSACLREI